MDCEKKKVVNDLRYIEHNMYRMIIKTIEMMDKYTIREYYDRIMNLVNNSLELCIDICKYDNPNDSECEIMCKFKYEILRDIINEKVL